MTTAQRARLVIAMGLLNLILATVALTAGFVAPPSPGGDVARIGETPHPTSVPASPSSSSALEPTPTSSVPVTPAPTPSAVEPSSEPSVVPSAEPSASPAAPSEGPIVADVPTLTPGATAPDRSPVVSTPRPTAPPTPRPTAHPTPRPTATPAPVVGKVHRPRPPCPADADGPPGHNKTAPPPSRPCAPAGHGKPAGSNGMVVVLPLALGGLAAAIRTRFAVASRRLAGASRSRAGRRGSPRVNGQA